MSEGHVATPWEPSLRCDNEEPVIVLPGRSKCRENVKRRPRREAGPLDAVGARRNQQLPADCCSAEQPPLALPSPLEAFGAACSPPPCAPPFASGIAPV